MVPRDPPIFSWGIEGGTREGRAHLEQTTGIRFSDNDTVPSILYPGAEKGLDSAMNTASVTPGGIDFNPDRLDLGRTKSGDLNINLDPAMLEKARNAAGFSPVILNVLTGKSLREFLGVQ